MIPVEIRESGKLFCNRLIERPEFLQQVQPLSAHFSLTVIDLDSNVGKSQFSYNVPELYFNYLGSMHGGTIATLLDDASAMTAGLFVGLAFKGTISSSIQYLRPLKSKNVSVKSEVKGYTTSLIFTESEIHYDEQVYAKSCSVMSYRSKI